MKTKLLIPILGLLVLTSCSSAYMASNPYDDVYYVPGQTGVKAGSEERPKTIASESRRQRNVESAEVVPEDQIPDNRDFARQQKDYLNVENPEYIDDSTSRPMVSDYTYSEDEYVENEYDYSSRIRRFQRPIVNVGYYDDYYTDYYWYTGDPWYSSAFFGPSFGMSLNWGWGNSWYYGYYPGYSSWYSPWYSPWYNYGYGWGGSSYWWGYQNGYWDGYWNGGHGGNWGGSNWNDNHFREPRGHRGSPDGAVSSIGNRPGVKDGSLSGVRTAASGGQAGTGISSTGNPTANSTTSSSSNLAHRRTEASKGNAVKPNAEPATPVTTTSTLEKRRTSASQTNAANKEQVVPAVGGTRTNSTEKVDENLSRTRLSNDVNRSGNAQKRYANPQGRGGQDYNYSRYSRSQSKDRQAASTSTTRVYTEPTTSRTRSSDEYSVPTGRSNDRTQRSTSTSTDRGGYTPPTSATPSRGNPSRNSATPARTPQYSTPTRTGSYSTPSRSTSPSSSGSFSSPSRSSSSPASSGGNSGGSGGGRRK